MLELFIALFGGAYYGFKLHNEKQKSKAADEANEQRIAAMRTDLSVWLAKVTDADLEYEVDKLIGGSSINEIYGEMAPVLSQIMPEIKNVYDFRGSIFYKHLSLIKLVLMAQHGKIPRSAALCGIRSPAVYDKIEIRKWKQVYSIMSWVDRELEKHGIEAMIFSDGCEARLARYPGHARPIGDVSTPIGGIYYWWSCRYSIII